MSAETDEAAADPVIEWPCDNGCGRWSFLRADIDGKRVCVRCWTRLGKPFAHYTETMEQQAARLDKIARAGIKAGGAAAYMVKAGKT